MLAHPDARGWVPPGGPHAAFYARFRVHKVYAFVSLLPTYLAISRSTSIVETDSLASTAPSRARQNGFGDVAYIGWIPLDLYRSSGAKMRSAKEIHRHWPVPEQPEQDELIALETDEAEQVMRILPYEEEVEPRRKDRFRIQW